MKTQEVLTRKVGFQHLRQKSWTVWWTQIMMGLFVWFLITRAWHYEISYTPQWFASILSWFLRIELINMFVHLGAVFVHVPVALVILLLMLFRRRWCFQQQEGLWTLRPWLACVIWSQMFGFNVIFDFNPSVAYSCFLSLLVFWWPQHSLFLTRLPSQLRRPEVRRILFLLFWCGIIAFADTLPDQLALALWFPFLAAGYFLDQRHWHRHLVVVSLLLLLPWIQLFSALLPYHIKTHEGLLMHSELAYDFCEDAAGERLFVSVPMCGHHGTPCQQGHVMEYDSHTLEPLRRHEFFDEIFYGRLERMNCLEDQVLIGMTELWYQEEYHPFNVLAFFPDNPEKNIPMLGTNCGPRIVYDATGKHAFFTGDSFIRYHLETGTSEDLWDILPFDHRDHFLLADKYAIHTQWQRLFLGEFMSGDWVYEVDLRSLEMLRQYQVGNGSIISITVDSELNRLYITGMWGLDVWDLAEHRVIHKQRTGMGARIPLIDSANNRIYMASTSEGKIWVLDRDSLEVIDVLAVGFDVRHTYLTKNKKHFLANTRNGYYAWPASL